MDYKVKLVYGENLTYATSDGPDFWLKFVDFAFMPSLRVTFRYNFMSS